MAIAHDDSGAYDHDRCMQVAQSLSAIFEEDFAMAQKLGEGIQHGVIDTLQLGYTERRIQHFNEQIDAAIGSENIPSHLRVETVLQPSQ